MRLNEQAIRAAEPPETGYRLLRDGEIPGFALRLTVNGARAFTLTYSIDGRERRMTIGGWPAWTATAARERAKELRRQIDRGQDPLAEKEARRTAPTVEEIAGEYLERHAVKKKSAKLMRQYLERDVLPVWGKWKAVDVQRSDVIALVERKAQSTPVAGNMLLAIVRGLFNWAIDTAKYDLQQNPALRVKLPAEKKARDRWLHEQEIRHVWARLDTAKMAPECRAALRLILLTGQRPGEVLGAEWTEVDLETAWWTIPATKAKNGFQHTVPLSALTVEQLNRLERGHWVIPSWYTQGHMTVAGLSNAVAVNQEHFGIPRWTPHDLRRTAATHLAKIGVQRFVIHRVIGVR